MWTGGELGRKIQNGACEERDSDAGEDLVRLVREGRDGDARMRDGRNVGSDTLVRFRAFCVEDACGELLARLRARSGAAPAFARAQDGFRAHSRRETASQAQLSPCQKCTDVKRTARKRERGTRRAAIETR